MQYAVQVTIVHRLRTKDPQIDETRHEHAILPAVGIKDAIDLQEKLRDALSFRGPVERRFTVVVRIHNADNQKGTWFSVEDLEHAWEDIKDDIYSSEAKAAKPLKPINPNIPSKT